MAALLVISPGASMAVVIEVALRRGKAASLLTVVGINIANTSLALASMFGLSAALHRWPWVLQVVSGGGAVYLTGLGLRSLWPRKQDHGQGGGDGNGMPMARSSAVVRGLLTNLLNPSVIFFYVLLLPQFIRNSDPFYRRFLWLAATHVSMSFLWLSTYALAMGTLSARMARPGVRRTMEIVTGAVLAMLGVRMLLA